MTAAYADFLERKRSVRHEHGFTPESVAASLYPFQRDVVSWATRIGRAAIFADCGLGKTPMQLEWARLVQEREGGSVLILAPLAVAAQTLRDRLQKHRNGGRAALDLHRRGDRVTDQLDIFHQPLDRAVREGSPKPELDGALTPSGSEQPDARANAQSLAPFSDRLRARRHKTQVRELAGTTWDDAFGDAA